MRNSADDVPNLNTRIVHHRYPNDETSDSWQLAGSHFRPTPWLFRPYHEASYVVGRTFNRTQIQDTVSTNQMESKHYYRAPEPINTPPSFAQKITKACTDIHSMLVEKGGAPNMPKNNKSAMSKELMTIKENDHITYDEFDGFNLKRRAIKRKLESDNIFETEQKIVKESSDQMMLD